MVCLLGLHGLRRDRFPFARELLRLVDLALGHARRERIAILIAILAPFEAARLNHM